MERWLIAVLLTAFGLACGGREGSEAGAEEVNAVADATESKIKLPKVVQQDAYTEEQFQEIAKKDSELSKVLERVKALGFVTFAGAGVTREEEGGAEVVWYEAHTASGERGGVMRHCASGDCLSAVWRMEEGGPVWEDASGTAVEPRGIGLPVLLKELEGHTYDKPTHVVNLALDRNEPLPEIDVTKRRMHVISSFGSLWASGQLQLDDLASRARGTGAFNEVLVSYWVGPDDVDKVWTSSHPYDALVWLGQTVREEAKTGKVWKPIGMTVNVGLFGDALYDRGRIAKKIELNPLGGPGLVLLIGCQSLGDGAGGGQVEKSLPVTLDNKARIVVGFEGCGDARDLLAAAEAFLEAYLAGKPLGQALESGNARLSSEKSLAKMVTLPAADPEEVFFTDLSKYWERYSKDGDPGDAFFHANIHIINQCEDSAGNRYMEDEAFVTAWSKETKFQGPFFTASRVNPDNNVDFKLQGALMTIEKGRHFFFTVTGDLSPKVRNLTLIADAVIDAVVLDREKSHEFIIKFKGQGKASPYRNENGDLCWMQDPYLVSSTGEPGEFKIPVAWKGQE